MNITDLARLDVRAMKGIEWGNPLPDDCLRLQFSERPEVFPPVLKALEKEMKSINLYPDISRIERIRTLIGERYGFTAKNVFLGSGVDSLIDLIARVFCEKGDEVLLTTPTYPCYEDAVRFMGATVVLQKLNDDFSLDQNAFMDRINSRTKLIFIANPNNPTGNILLSVPQIERLLKQYSGILVIDEEYFDFSNVTALPLLKRYENLIVFRGVSKSFGVAGLRLGVAFGNEAVIRLFDASQGATQVFEVNRLALAAAEAIFSDQRSSTKFIEKFTKLKRDFEKALGAIPGVNVRQTCTSFTIFSTPLSGDEVRAAMLQQKIAIKSMSIYNQVPRDLVMTAVPLRPQFDRVLSALTNIVTASSVKRSFP